MNAFAVLAEPARRRILDALLEGERPVAELVDALGLSQPTVSKHLRVLRDAGMVAVRVDAQHRRYRVAPAALAEIDAWLAPYRRLWTGRLDALERYLDQGSPSVTQERPPEPPPGPSSHLSNEVRSDEP